MFRSLRPAGPLDVREEIAGPALEGLVLRHLRAWIDYGAADCRISFWRTRGGSEGDFVLYGAAGFYAIEVKNSRSLRPRDLRGIKTFGQDYPEASLLLLYRGEETSGARRCSLHAGRPLPARLGSGPGAATLTIR